MMEKPNALDIARSLVRIPSVNPSFDPASAGELEMAAWLVRWAEAEGFRVTEQPVLGPRANVLITHEFEKSGPTLLWNGHTDTVGVGGMTIDPFGGEVRGGRLFGRGSADMKGPLACMMAALAELRREPGGCRGRIILAAVVDEEYRFAGTRKLLEEFGGADFAVVGEPTGLELVRGCKGCLRFSVTTHGRAVHSSRPWEGASAIVAMAAVINRLQDYFDRRLSLVREDVFTPSTGSIGLISGGVGVNVVPDQCSIEIDIRLLPSQDGHLVHEEVSALLDDLELPKGTSCAVDDPGLCDPGFVLPADLPLVLRLEKTLSVKADVVTFSCDASKIAAAGIPCVVLGPGDIASAHTADESIALDDLSAGVDAYLRVARSLLA